ncbi:hypothetical protein [Terrimonas ferruginea]|uniref:hypothetical protein n=1 Tax=Terrimonas ferruginea TaxID=249 RepID=UPI00049159EC|nr:hypothetical protein [Terrimonas ferruginea]
MRHFFSLLLVSVFLFSCRKSDKQGSTETVRVIDRIEIKKTTTSTGNVLNNKITFEYNNKKEIAKIATFEENVLYYSYTYTYQNNIPVSSRYDFTFGGDPVYEVRYGYVNGRYASYYDTYYDDITNFSYNQQFNQYTNSINGNRFILNEAGDVSVITASGNEYAFAFDQTKKGPLYNVVNKKWIPALWYGLAGLTVVEITTYPVTSLFDDNIAQVNPYTNTFDADGFVTKSIFSVANGSLQYEVTYVYKSI